MGTGPKEDTPSASEACSSRRRLNLSEADARLILATEGSVVAVSTSVSTSSGFNGLRSKFSLVMNVLVMSAQFLVIRVIGSLGSVTTN
jgi:hypothetical protein